MSAATDDDAKPVPCCERPAIRVNQSLGPNGPIGAFLMCARCCQAGPVVGLGTIGQSSPYRVCARAWNRRHAR